MDPATLIGIVMTLGAIFATLTLEGSSVTSILLLPPLILVFVGTFGAGIAGHTMADAKKIVPWLKLALMAPKVPDAGEQVTTLTQLAETARKSGLLALDGVAKELPDPFLRKAVQLTVDGTDPEALRDILESEIDAKKAADKAASRFFADLGGYAPTIGIIGTVLGLVHVLENLSDPESLGPLIAGAFVATLWGVLSANAFWLPMSRKITRVSELQTRSMQLYVEGVAEIQAGSSPRTVRQRLSSLVGPGELPEAA
jgi:chemotaxis protein MotA